MPLYEYQCLKCGEILEIIQKFSDKPATRCTRCGGKLEKLLSSPAIQFKGSGWYVTDYAARKEPVAAKESKSADSSSSKTSEKADSKGD